MGWNHKLVLFFLAHVDDVGDVDDLKSWCLIFSGSLFIKNKMETTNPNVHTFK